MPIFSASMQPPASYASRCKYTKGLALEKGRRIEVLYRNVRNLIIYEGTSEIPGQTIARQLFREGP
ncbi:MAG: hypothetical protein IIB29_07435 [Chloroflexi bacterium]|nr:hypothetical protein [Chloroflexota bacterium]